jgi:arylsulfatase A-like enzyme
LRTSSLAAIVTLCLLDPIPAPAEEKPNVVLIVCDDLNDYIEGLGGHPQAQTPNITRLRDSGVSFTQAHCNSPICAPSRASLFTGIYPHHSGCYGFTKWNTYEVLKNSLWQESTQVPLIVRVPRIARAGTICGQPVSLIDLYPTLIDLCNLTGNTMKNDKGRPLDGHSMRPLLADPEAGQWSGPDEALTTLYKWRTKYDPSRESYSLRSRDWRYIRYANGMEELYQTAVDPYEWNNLADKPKHAEQLTYFRERLQAELPRPGSIPPQPVWKPKDSK